jgi:hypothetical protein
MAVRKIVRLAQARLRRVNFSGAEIIVDMVFSPKMRSDFQNFSKFLKILENFAIVLEFFGEFPRVFGAAEKWKNNSGIYGSHRAHRGHRGFSVKRVAWSG